ncbi:MAG TPA: signal transduction protein with Nacht domain protein, partial [Cyanobacteria bacterium UBA8543]|nr:signal transduction protein with Nacht domain protein [Cyanobacteria bacterium UBA8543]
MTDAIHLVLEAQTVVREEAGGREREEPRQQVEPFPVLERLRKYAATHHVLLSGKPGSGKSTTLKRLLWEMAEAAQEDDEQPIPVLVQLKSDRSVLKSIQDEFEKGDLDCEVNEKDIKRLLRKKRLSLLLDGVNEIPSEELWRELQQFREDNPHTPMIFTTRDLAVRGDLGIEKKLEMRSLTDIQLREFVGKYLPDYGEVLLGQLKDRLREVAETPLLLKMLCEVFDPQTQQIPKSKGELFRAFDRKYNQHKQKPPVSGDFRRFQSEVLQHLAFEMVRGDAEKPTETWLTIARSKAEGILEAWLGKRGVADAATKAKEWLEDLLEHHLLQVAAGQRQIEFHHQLFQEYYAAEALLARVENRHPDVVDDGRLQHFYLNYLKWTEP